MQTTLAPRHQGTPEGEQAAAALRACVHCGFCLATCPTYRELGDERDSPRGRIYLMKQLFEGAPGGAPLRRHLDRCLTCRACETACPSGVAYGRLLDAGRAVLAREAPRPAWRRLGRGLLRIALTTRPLFAGGLALARALRPLLPQGWRTRVPPASAAGDWPPPRHPRRMVVLRGCVQPALDPGIDAAAARVLDAVGISLLAVDAGCCGALAHHLDQHEAAAAAMRRSVRAAAAALDAGAEAVVSTASGCGVMLKDLGWQLREDPALAADAARVSAQVRDIGEVVLAEAAALRARVAPAAARTRVAWQAPCTLQHGQRRSDGIGDLLAALGYELSPVADAALCCGSAGTYSLLQPALAAALRRRKLAALEAGRPQLIATANIGCQTHLQAGSARPVRHWIVLVDAALRGVPPA